MPDTQHPPAERDADAVPEPQPLDAASLKALGHPVRLRILSTLGLRGAMNVKQLAAAIGEPANSVSYHVSQLAAHGLVAAADPPAGATRRERWWQTASPGGFQYTPGEVDDPVGAATVRTWLQQVFSDSVDRMLASQETNRELGFPLANGQLGAWLTRDEARQVEKLMDEAFMVMARRFHEQRDQGTLATGPGGGEHQYVRLDALLYPDLTGHPDPRMMRGRPVGPAAGMEDANG